MEGAGRAGLRLTKFFFLRCCRKTGFLPIIWMQILRMLP